MMSRRELRRRLDLPDEPDEMTAARALVGLGLMLVAAAAVYALLGLAG